MFASRDGRARFVNEMFWTKSFQGVQQNVDGKNVDSKNIDNYKILIL